MTKQLTILFFSILFPVLLFAQKNMIRGVVSDANSGETLIGATILYGEGKGAVTDMDGRYYLKVEPGTYHLKVSYVGYLPVEADVTVGKEEVTQNFSLKTPTLTEVEVIGDVAKTRETPVAFSTVQPIKLQEELASRDIPMILNKTPGVYATQQGGGDGDARINIRGFNQRNLAVMIDGIPVNDMENGWVYWSNWFGLDAVTRNIQVQRGLGASKLALPSVGGTMNIITKGIEANFGASIKQEVGSDGYLRTSLGVTTGQLKHGWGITLAGSYKQGNGWVDNTWTKGWFGYIRVDKKLGHHTLTFSAMGAPQKHAQRAYMKSIGTFDKAYAEKLGVDVSKAADYGLRYNSNWGRLNRWNWGPNDESGKPTKINTGTSEDLTQSLNYYFKPQLSLRDFWHINDKFYLSNILYASIGSGGGTGNYLSNIDGSYSTGTFDMDATGQINYQKFYNQNMTVSAYDKNKLPGQSLGIIRSSMNNHRWFGLLSTFSWDINPNWNLSGGLDLRTYKAQHYAEVYDLLGGEFMRDNNNHTQSSYIHQKEGDKIYYYNDALVRWGGLFSQLEFKKGPWSAFVNLTAAVSAYKRIDYFKKMDLLIDGRTYAMAVGDSDIFYSNGTQNLTYNYSQKDSTYMLGDTVFVKHGDSTQYIVNATAYNTHSSQARTAQTDWKTFGGFTIKVGANYNINKRNNVFMNLGYLSKAPRFSNVFNNANKAALNTKNEIIEAVEVGYSYNSKKVALNVNAYFTNWVNKPVDVLIGGGAEGDNLPKNTVGINALHKGIEVEFGWKPFSSLQWDQVLSWGDWRWTSEVHDIVYDPTGTYATAINFNAKGVHVGDAAQFQFMESVRWEIIKYLYVSSSFTLFDKNFSQMDPTSLDPTKYPNSFDADGNPRDSWRLPLYYLVDLNAGYRFVFKRVKLDVRASVLNLLDRAYISDAKNNDSYSTSTQDFNAASAGVFFGQGRTFNASVALSF
ncbi:MAG: TonB-dependent receptor [Bacteroidetes bacterium]|nr:TonB-dependent receptor [Bacteroidota bacterium]